MGPISIRNEIRTGDVERIIRLHVDLFGREHGLDATFADHIRGPLTAFIDRRSPRERLWIAERDGVLVGCAGLFTSSDEPVGKVSQLRWFLVDPSVRGEGLGTRLLSETIAFSRQHQYTRMILWTLTSLLPAIRLYVKAGFAPVEQRPGHRWSRDVVEEKYELEL